MKDVMSARQWKSHRASQEALIAASTGGKLPGSDSRNYFQPRFTEMDFSSGVRTLHYDDDGQPIEASKSR
jgi:hypothetical protein